MYDDNKDRVREPKHTTEEHELTFNGYDDDGILYCTGTCKKGEFYECDLLDVLKEGWGITLIKLFDRKTGEYLDPTKFPA